MSYFYLPIYKAFTKPILIAGLPFEMAISVGAGMIAGAFIFNSIMFTLFFLVLYFILYLIVKFSPKFDAYIIKILVNISFKKYIDY